MAIFVGKQSRYEIIGFPGFSFIRPEVDERGLFPVKSVQPSAPGAYPQISIGIEFKGPDMVVRDAGAVFGIIAKDRKAVTVIPVKSILGAKPQEPHFVLNDTGDIALRKAIHGAYSGK
jgi:hypothetical protein